MSNIERCKKLIQQYLFHLKQNINLDSLTCSLDCIKNPYLLKPYKYCKLSPENIRDLISKDDIEAICFDKDNCITLPFDNEIHQKVRPVWNECIRILGNDKIVIISNSIGGPDDAPEYKMAKHWEEMNNVHVLRHCKKKPACGKDILSHFGSIQGNKIAVIGDRLFTDVLMANLFGLKSILVDPLNQSMDPLTVRFTRNIENRILRSWYQSTK